ncbi:MAG: hypothetical protein ACO3MD_05880, partial [Candidatus Nanopelagicales bacterium]
IVGEPLHPWLEWLPVRKLTPEEAALRKRLKEEEFRENARLAARLTGWRIDIRPDGGPGADPAGDPAGVPSGDREDPAAASGGE